MKFSGKHIKEIEVIGFTHFPVTQLSGKNLPNVAATSDESKPLAAEQWAVEAQRLVMADDPAKITVMEARLGCTQADAVTHFVEHSCCSDDLPDFQGGKGTPQDRRSALLALWKDCEGERRNA